MSAPDCPRLFEVEALRNGRLAGPARAHFERHLSQCAACSSEAEALESLSRALREAHPPTHDELHVRRERTRLLAAFDRTLIAEPVRRPARLWFALAASCVVAALAVCWFWPKAPAELAPAPRALIQSHGDAVWTRSGEPGRERLVLARGSLTIQVTHSANQPGVLVVLPDGELEDTGTIFSVTVENGRTAKVSVREGSVALRLRDRPPIALRAGESWRAPEPALVPSVAAPTVPSAAVVDVAPAPSRATPPPPPRASEDFRAAVSALNSGDNTGAATRFERFLKEHPRDARGEDAAYLRVLALKRAGSRAAMNAAAREYLLRYPNGFRRREVERLE